MDKGSKVNKYLIFFTLMMFFLNVYLHAYILDNYVNVTKKLLAFLIVTLPICVLYLILSDNHKNEYAIKKVTIKEKKNDSKDVISKLSHEIRTPISGLIGLLNLIKNDHDFIKNLPSYIFKMEIQTTYLLDVVNNILDTYKIKEGKMNICNSYFDLDELLEVVSCNIENFKLSKNIEFIIEKGNIGKKIIYSDRTKLCQILINIISNAIKFSKDGGKVIFKISQTTVFNKTFMKFVITDFGVGMSEEFQNKMFEDFIQEKLECNLDTLGSGLGLGISKMFVDMLKGNIIIDSKLNHGTKVIIDICIDDIKTESMPPDYKFQNKRILLAEDNDINQEVTTSILSILGIKTDIAKDGHQALKIYESSPLFYYDLILMDIHMPDMDGFNCTKYIRCTDREDNNIKIIALTAETNRDEIKKSIAENMNDYLEKPYSFDAIADMLYYYLK